MYYALTLNGDTITGIHENTKPIIQGHFTQSPKFMNDIIVSVEPPFDYITNMNINCYNEDGSQKPIVWCIEQGYIPLPPYTEIINGELVNSIIPAEQQPQTVSQFIEEKIAQTKAESTAKFTSMKPLMTDLVKDKPANTVIGLKEFILDWVPGNYIIGDIRIFENEPRCCIQLHDSIDNPTWTPDVSSLWAPYHATTEEFVLDWRAPTGSHDIYKIGEFMRLNMIIYKCIEDTNFSPFEYATAWHVKQEDGSFAAITTEPPIEEPPTEDPPIELNSNGTMIWSDWVTWDGINEHLYQIGDRVTYNSIRYTATADNNHWTPEGYGWIVS